MLLTLAILFIKFFFKKSEKLFKKSEKLDERAIHNLFKAGGIILGIFLLFLHVPVEKMFTLEKKDTKKSQSK